MNGCTYNMSPKTNGIPLNLLLQLRHKIQHNTLHNTNFPNPPPPTLYPRKNGQLSPAPHHRSGKSPTSSNTQMLIFPSNATTPWLNFWNQPGTHTPPPHSRKVASTQSPACYIRHNNPQSAYTLHILQHRHEYGSMDQTMTLLKP
jgi:hypothetical protein